MARRTHRSLGEMISTVSFYGVSAAAFVHGLASIEEGEPVYKTALIFVASFLCFLGGARYSIANMFDQSQRRKK